MARKIVKKDKYEGLTLRQQNIIKMRDELNKKNPDDIKAFGKYKMITYVMNIILPPYALYRIWKKDSPFCITEQVGQTMVCILYMYALFAVVI